MNDQVQIETEQQPAPEADGWEWMLVEIMGHRTHWGRAREEELFGAKMLRIDVPKLIFSEQPDPEMPRVNFDPPRIQWVSHYYGGASIFSFTLTDEATVMKRNRPYEAPSRLSLAAPQASDFDDYPDDDEEGGA